MAQYMKLSTFIQTQFAEGEAPSKATVTRWMKNKELPGRRIGNIYYVDMDRFNRESMLTGNDLVDRVMMAS